MRSASSARVAPPAPTSSFMETPEFALLRTFRSLFEGIRYKHRDSSLGDFVASQLYEDLVAINHAENYTCYEGERPWRTDGRKYKHPIQEAAAAKQRLTEKALPSFDEFLFLLFRAANIPPYPFEWLDHQSTVKQYAALLV